MPYGRDKVEYETRKGGQEMKAPDKLYLQTNKGETLSSKWTTNPFRDFENTEYIRKDALLKWLKARMDSAMELYKELDDTAFATLADENREIIKHINEI